MKPLTYWIGSEAERQRAIKFLQDAELDGALKCVFTDTRSKSVQARGTQWKWYTEVAESGIGRHDHKNDVHIDAKYLFARPILLRDDEMFAAIWPEIEERYKNDPEKLKYAVEHFISTEGEGFAVGEYMQDFERYWRDKGVDLFIPDPRFREWMGQREAENNSNKP